MAGERRVKRWVSRALFLGASLAIWTLGVSPGYAQSAADLLGKGQWEEARQEALIRDDAESLLIRARFAHWSGEDEEALRFARAAVEVESPRAVGQKAQVELARQQWFIGDRDAALERLRAVLQDDPGDIEARFELGWRLIDDGDVEEGQAILEALARRYNDGLITDADELVWVGRAMMAADRPRDANRALGRALTVDEDHLEAHLRLGQLMWSRYNTAEAEASFEEVLKRQPNHPEALAGMAEIEFFRSGRFEKAMELLEQAGAKFPQHPALLQVRGRILLAQGSWQAGLVLAGELLERAPLDGEALALQASAAYLLGEQELFEESLARFDERRSTKPELLTEVGEAAAFNRLQHEAIRFFEAALRRDPDFGPALSGLGLALTRIGEETRAVDILERAFAKDRYHVRVFNTLEFYERGLNEYLTDEAGGFRLRAHISQFDLLREQVVPMVEEARQDFGERYGIELESLTVEVYPDSQAFSVRSVGLPHIDPHGICFGPVVLTRSPGTSDFNWALVVWHELAHSYHLQLSNYRVPRWFTEGLAEYETWRKDPSWTRFHDLDLARRLRHGKLWSIGELDQAFMVGRGAEISHVYQTAQLVMAFLEESYGFDVIRQMLERFGQEGRSDVVFEEVLGQSLAEIDAQFQAWFGRRLGGIHKQELIDWVRVAAMIDGDEVEHESSAHGAAYRALVAAVQENREQAQAQLDSALARGEEEPAVRLVAMSVYDLLDEIEAGLLEGRRLLEQGLESVELRLIMASLTERAGLDEEAFVHRLSAVMMAPNLPKSWHQLGNQARALGEERISRQAQIMLFWLDPHSAQQARGHVEAAKARGEWAQALEAARRWAQIGALDGQAHLAVARNAMKIGAYAEARQGYFQAWLASSGLREEIFEEALQELEGQGLVDEARRFEEQVSRAAAGEK